MPVEIRELVIKATVSNEGSGNHPSSSGNSNTDANEELIKTIVEKVMELIREKNGR